LFSYVESLFSDPRATIMFFLLAFPGRIIALSVHEFAHAWMANRCGDPTARMLGRMTLNPAAHLDLVGTLMMAFLGFGWAKPVPVNPRNFRNYRRDDLKVSLAGVTMNFLMFILGSILMYAVIALALVQVPLFTNMREAEGTVFRSLYEGMQCVFIAEADGISYCPIIDLLIDAPYVGKWFIGNIFGSVAGYAYQMLSYFVLTNLILGIFNLLPVPPLDGYHVLNDLFLRRSNLFADPRTVRVTSGVMMLLVFTGALGRVLGWVDEQILSGVGNLAAAVFRAAGFI